MRVFLFFVLFTAWMTAGQVYRKPDDFAADLADAEVGHQHHHHSEHHHHHHEHKVGDEECGWSALETGKIANGAMMTYADGTKWKVVANADGCKANCEANSPCDGYVYQTQLKRCWMKKGSTKLKATNLASRAASFNKGACPEELAPAEISCVWQPLTDNKIPNGKQVRYDDDDVFKVAPDVDDCKAKCLNNPPCDGYVHQKRLNRCWMKSGSTAFETAGSKKDRQSSYCAACKWAPMADDKIPNGAPVLYSDGDVFKVVADIDECKGNCLDNPPCDGYAYHKNLNRCWMKSGSTDFATSTQNYRQSSYCAPCEWQEWVPVADELIPNGAPVAYSDGDVYKVVTDIDACKDNCLANLQCNGYVFHTNLNRCWMKSGSTGFATTTNKYRQSSYSACESAPAFEI